MAKYVYPAVFTPEENGMYSVNFPDLEGCYTCGEDLTEAITMAEDALALMLYDFEVDHRTAPSPSSLSALDLKDGEFANYIVCDTIGYQKRSNNKAIKKTLSIPEWLNEVALAHNANFSQILQDALMQKYNVG